MIGAKYQKPKYNSSEWVMFVLTALGGWLLPAQELMPFALNCFVIVIAVVMGGRVLWRWEETSDWSRFRKIAVCALAIPLFAVTFWPNVRKQYDSEYGSFHFRESAELDWWDRVVAIREIANMRDYLKGLGIPVPDDTPPLGVTPGARTSNAKNVHLPPGLPLYRGELNISERDALQGDIREFANQYADYVVMADTKLMEDGAKRKGPVNSPETKQLEKRFMINITLAMYFYWSFLGENLGGKEGRGTGWEDALWRVRSGLGKDYCDRLMATTLKTFIDSPQEGIDADTDTYFCQHLRTAFGVIDNGAKKWTDVTQPFESATLIRSCPAN